MNELQQCRSNVAPVDAPSPRERAPLRLRLINLGAVLIPLVGFIAAIVLLWGVALDWTHLVIFAVMYIATGLGVTVGYHRLFTHRSFAAPRPVRFLLAVFGSMAVQGPLLEWVATHRKHHQHSDQHGDPHSPHCCGDTITGVLRGMWHAHLGWLFEPHAHDLDRYVQDLRKDRIICFVNGTFPLWVVLGLLLPAALGGIITGTWFGVLLGFIWGGLVRIFLVHHITWSVNSVCHIWGAQPFRTRDESRDNPIVGVLAFGEGWHNTHHAFPTSARHGLGRWQFDFSYLVIRAMGWVGLARNIRVPSRQRIEKKRM